jgi:hypothetical protein
VDGKWAVVNSGNQRDSAGGKKKKDDEHFIKLVYLFNTGKIMAGKGRKMTNILSNWFTSSTQVK